MKKKKKPTLLQYLKKFKPKFCVMCGSQKVKQHLISHYGDNEVIFPFWQVDCTECNFNCEVEADVHFDAVTDPPIVISR